MSGNIVARKFRALKHLLFGWGPTWSQFGEDAHLRAFFRDKGWTKEHGFRPSKPGFYVDVGCCHPIHMSNTLWFSKKGWRGINIDATPGSKALFDRWRPRDVNLELAVSTRDGELTFYTEGGKLSVYNTTSLEQARKLIEAGTIRNPVEISVQCMPLSKVLDRYLPPNTQLDFFSVDAEGNDLDVLRSNDWLRYRPELVLVEAHTNSFDELTDSELIKFMREQKYTVRAWVRPNLVLQREG